MSSPARRMLASGSVAGTRTPPSTRSVRSTGTTAVAPSGTAPPVEIAIVAPGLTATWAGCPARASPISSSSPPSPATTA